MTDDQSKLSNLRQEIDKIDEKLIQIIAKRRGISAKIGMYKEENSLSIVQRKREKSALKKRIKQAKKLGFKKRFTKRLFRLIFCDSRKVQKHPRGFDKKPKN